MKAIFCFFFLIFITIQADAKITWLSPSGDTLPPIFMIGQHSEAFEKLNSSSNTLLQVCQNDVYLAYDKWLHVLAELEATADQLAFNLKGTKLWCSIFWNQDGTIRHFAYHPKPGSENIDHEAFTQLLKVFIVNYKLPIQAMQGFYNYGSVVFPIPSKKQLASRNPIKP